MSRGKVTAGEQIKAAKACVEGRMSESEAARRLGVGWTRINEWVARYKFQGELAFCKQKHNTVYSEELKTAAVKEYLSGNGSQTEIAAKYGLRSTHQLREWIKVYNSGGCGGDFDCTEKNAQALASPARGGGKCSHWPEGWSLLLRYLGSGYHPSVSFADSFP